MRIDVIGRHMEITDAIETYAQAKSEKVLKVFDGVQSIRMILEQGKHMEFEVEVIVDVVKHDDFVASVRDSDLYGAIDQATDKVLRQLRDHKEKLRLH